MAATACLPGCTPAIGAPGGKLLAPSMALGHKLRGYDFPPPTQIRHIDVAIIGGGVAGLSAAWQLQRSGMGEFRLFELEPEVGGNARSGRNAVSAYPWGAHYLPLPGMEAGFVRELLADLGVLQGDPYTPAPRYDERYLCFAPQERLYKNGLWQEGLLPQIGATAQDQAQYRQFFQLITAFQQKRGSDGRRAFALPMALSSQDAELRALDRLSIHDYLLQQGLTSSALHWYVNYACRDDYGTDYRRVSAWAGLHYFASRDGRGLHTDSDEVLTWPEGNGWLTSQLHARLSAHIQTGALVYRVETGKSGVSMDIYDPATRQTTRWYGKQLIFAAPAMILPHVWTNPVQGWASAAREVSYAPWLVANLTVDRPPLDNNGAELAWDNVLYDSPALGYVVATHQNLRSAPAPSVLTYYRSFSDWQPHAARTMLLATTQAQWAASILQDLSGPHPDLRHAVQQIDVFRWGHAMARPLPGFLQSRARLQLADGQHPQLQFAHADASGFSIFEEANYRGVTAAQQALARLA
jgi:protoporphyrinogen oxidase